MSNNSVTLQGWLTLRQDRLRRERTNGKEYLVMDAEVDTDKPYLGGRHPVVLEGRPAELALALLEAQQAKRLRVQATVRGKLLTIWQRHTPRTVVVARYVDFQPNGGGSGAEA